jgi:hypothetical protein
MLLVHWIVEHKTEEMIEMVTRGMLEQLLIDVHYLAVRILKLHLRFSDTYNLNTICIGNYLFQLGLLLQTTL